MSSVKFRTREFRKSESGAALIEFSLFVSVLVLLLVSMVDYAMEIQQAQIISEAASAGASFGAIPGNQKNLAGMQSAATAAAVNVSNFSVSATNVFTCTPGGASVPSSTQCANYGTPIEYVVVNTSGTSQTLISWAGIAKNPTLSGHAMFRVPWTP